MIKTFTPENSPNYTDMLVYLCKHLDNIYHKNHSVNKLDLERTRKEFIAKMPEIRQKYYQIINPKQRQTERILGDKNKGEKER